MLRKIAVAAALGVAALTAAGPAGALSPGQTVCYAADGSAVVNPTNPDDFEYCVTRESSGGSGGGNTPQLCSAVVHSYGSSTPTGTTTAWARPARTP